MKKLKVLSLVLMFMLGVMCFSACKLNFDKTSTYEIMSYSMAPTLVKGDKVKVKEQDNFIVGDIVIFTYDSLTIVHRVIYIAEESGVKYYVCKGDNNQNLDGSDSDCNWIDDAAIIQVFMTSEKTVQELKNEYGGMVQVVTQDQILGVAEKVN